MIISLVAVVVVLSHTVAASPSSPGSRFRSSHYWKQTHRTTTTAAQKQRRQLHNEDGSPIVQTDIRAYELWAPHEITETVQKWAEHYPNLIRVTTAQDAYGLPTAGAENDCPFDEGVVGCLNQILILQDFVAHPENSESSQRLPELLWSGELHGNEQVGPTAVLEAAQLLMDAATCEGIPRMALHGDAAWETELDRAHACRQDLAERGIDDRHRQWLARLLTTRRIVIIPTANALGYYQKVREENRIDPNRDFPYDLTDPTMCMQTIAGRTVNEVVREHLFQLSLTFHGGMEVVGYEWGAPTWMDHTSPDDTAQSDIATAYSQFGGTWATTKPYAHGPYVSHRSGLVLVLARFVISCAIPSSVAMRCDAMRSCCL
jgi:Zinc carboxypeptidase